MSEPYSLFEKMFQLWYSRGGMYCPHVTEECERFYLQRVQKPPQSCRHGRTFLTCPDCYLNGFERGDAI